MFAMIPDGEFQEICIQTNIFILCLCVILSILLLPYFKNMAKLIYVFLVVCTMFAYIIWVWPINADNVSIPHVTILKDGDIQYAAASFSDVIPARQSTFYYHQIDYLDDSIELRQYCMRHVFTKRVHGSDHIIFYTNQMRAGVYRVYIRSDRDICIGELHCLSNGNLQWIPHNKIL